MTQQFVDYLVPLSFSRFQWHKFSGQEDASVTYIYLVTPPVSRLQGQSSILYIGKTEQAISKRFIQATRTKNTPGNSQATNIRSSHISQLLFDRGDKIELYFTHGLLFELSGKEANDFEHILQIWNKSHYLKFFKPDSNGNVDVSIEKYLLVEYSNIHLEVPPLNNAG